MLPFFASLLVAIQLLHWHQPVGARTSRAQPLARPTRTGGGAQLVIIGLSQLPLEAEGYRHIVCLIDSYASSYGVLTKDLGLESDSGIALKQTCRAVHAWYHWTAEERGLVLHETSSEDEE